MRSFYYAILAMLLSAPAFTQVGINTTDPSSTLDVQASNSASPASTDGILIPRVTAFPSTNPGANQDGMLIFLSNAIGVSDKGFYSVSPPYGDIEPGLEDTITITFSPLEV